MDILNVPADALEVRKAIAKSFSIKDSTGFSTAASKSAVQSNFRSGVSMVKSGLVTTQKDKVLVEGIRAFADLSRENRIYTIRNLFLKAIVMTFPKINLDDALVLASVKALISCRESGGVVSWTLEGSSAFIGGNDSGWKNINGNQTYASGVSGTGLIQWTADRQKNFLNRMGTLSNMGFSEELAFIDPGFQALYWAAELADRSGLNSEINGAKNQGGVFFSNEFARMLQGLTNYRINVGHVYGAMILWQMGAGFGIDSVTDRKALIYGQDGMNLSFRRNGLTAFDMYTAYRLGIKGYFPSNSTFTINDFCEGISLFVKRLSKSVPYNYAPADSYFYKGFNPKNKKIAETFLVRKDQNILTIFNLI